MFVPILFIPDAMICKSRLPNLSVPFQLSLGAKRKTAFDQLDRFFDRLGGSNKQMQVIGHDDIGVKFVSGPVIMAQC